MTDCGSHNGRPCMGHAHYKGNVNPVGEVMGPNLFGELLVATTAEYDTEENRTTVTFALATQHDVDAANGRAA